MPYSRTYSRLFITLKQERPDYCFDFRPAMGRGIIELKNNSGKINVYVQGLKPKVFYKVYLVSSKDNNSLGVPVGFIDIDNNGKGELKKNFEPNNVYNSNLPIENFNIIAVIVQGSQEIKAPLAGYTDGTILWKNNFSFFDAEKDNSIQSENIIKDDTKVENQIKEELNNTYVEKSMKESTFKQDADNQEAKKEEISEINVDNSENSSEEVEKDNINNSENSSKEVEKDNIDNSENTFKETSKEDDNIENENPIHDSFSNEELKIMAEKFKKEIDELKYYASMKEEDAKKNNEFIKEEIKKDISDIDYIFDRNKDYKPFKNDNRQWTKTDLKELSILNNNMWKYTNNPFIACNCKRYRHLLLGKDDNNLVLGVPARYNPCYNLEAQVQGFNKFKCIEDKKPEINDFGYWLIDIN